MCSLKVLIFCIKERVENSVPMELDKHSQQHVNICSGLYIYIIFFTWEVWFHSSNLFIRVYDNSNKKSKELGQLDMLQ